MEHKTIAQHGIALRKGTYSSLELTHYFLDQIASNNDLNAFITITEEQALADAHAADQQLKSDSAGPLTGIPVAHKDIFCTRNTLTSCGSKILSNFISPYDATAVSQLTKAGMVMLGKTNMDEFAMGSSTETSYYGAVKNPWNKQLVPGGSSGGSAAAVAAGLTQVATGTDTGGSIRQPAAFCNLTGIKPSYGRISRFGMIAFASSLDQGGILSRSVEDAAYLLETMSGFDYRDATSIEAEVPNYHATLNTDIRGKTIGLPRSFFCDGIDIDIVEALEQAIAQLKSMGVKIIEVDLPNNAVSIPCYYIIAPAEASSNLSRYDGVRYGLRACNYEDLTDMYESTRAEGFGDEVKRRIMIGTYVLSSGYYDAYYVQAQKLRRMIVEDYNRALEKCDLLLGPTTPTTAFKIGAKNNDPVKMYLNDIFTSSVNLAGLPALSIPAGFDKQGLPIGMHLIGRYLDEATILNVGHQYQQATDWHLQRPRGYV